VIKLPAHPPGLVQQVIAVEKDLLESVETLKGQNWIFGPLPAIEDIVNPKEESESFEDSPYAFPGGNHKIISQVEHEVMVQSGEIQEAEGKEDEEDEDPGANITRCQVITLAAQLEQLTMLQFSYFCLLYDTT